MQCCYSMNQTNRYILYIWSVRQQLMPRIHLHLKHQNRFDHTSACCITSLNNRLISAVFVCVNVLTNDYSLVHRFSRLVCLCEWQVKHCGLQLAVVIQYCVLVCVYFSICLYVCWRLSAIRQQKDLDTETLPPPLLSRHHHHQHTGLFFIILIMLIVV